MNVDAEKPVWNDLSFILHEEPSEDGYAVVIKENEWSSFGLKEPKIWFHDVYTKF